jgi:hypothetical protein
LRWPASRNPKIGREHPPGGPGQLEFARLDRAGESVNAGKNVT